jgi:hypothetical protein
MKKLFVLTLLVTLFLQGKSWGSDCIGFENMAVKILRQESNMVYLAWNASVVNKCDKMISAKVQIQLVDKKDKSLGDSFQLINQLLPNETRKIRNEKSLPSEKYFKIQAYYFKARELSAALN